MNNLGKTKEELIIELLELKKENSCLKSINADIHSENNCENILLEQTRKNYESFFNTISDFLFVLNEQGDIIHTNNTVIERLGYTREELMGLSVLMLHPANRRDEAGRIVGEMLKGVSEFCPVPIVAKSGVQIPVETRVSHGMWDGKPVIFGVTKDISKVKLSEEKFSKVFYLNPSVCGLSDLDNGKYIEVNDKFYSLLGFEKKEVIGKTAIEIGILSSEAVNVIMSKAEKNGKVSNVETNLKAKNGDVKNVILSAENIFIQDKKYRFTVVHDITELKQAEAKIKLKNEELLKINSEKDKFFSIIAHDLRSPFSGFLGLTEIMAVDLQNLTMNQIQEFAIDIRTSATNLYRLLNNLLEWAQLQKGTISFAPSIIKFIALANECINFVTESAKTKGIEIVLNAPEELEIFADKNMLQTVIRNFMSNAVKFTKKGGKVILSAKLDNANCVEISINDTGIGMDQCLMNDLFKIDVQSARKGTEGELSSGLGLLLCKEFVEKHEGKIWVESSVGVGTTFYFSLPFSCKNLK